MIKKQMPVMDEDQAFPGENWFFYWKTSASLWKTKLESIAPYEKVIIPINWCFHTETGESHDFGELRPETDIARLVSIIRELNRNPVLFLPITPAPFLPNGGVPPFLARVPSIDEEGQILWSLSPDNEIFKMYSFFDQRIFKGFAQFALELGQHLSQYGVDCDLWGISCGQISSHGFSSYLNDNSSIFKESLQRYLGTQGLDLNSLEGEEKFNKKQQFVETIQNLYEVQASESLMANWEGVVKVSFLGGSPKDLINRTLEVDTLSTYAYDLMESMSYNYLASSVLIPSRIKSGVLNEMLDELIAKSMIHHQVQKNIYDDSGEKNYTPLRFFEVFDLQEGHDPMAIIWADLGLWEYLQDNFNWCFSDNGSKLYQFDESVDCENKVYFFHGKNISSDLLSSVLRTFLAGGKVIFNRSGLDRNSLKKLEAFFLENSLNVEMINFKCPVHNVVLGEGRIVLFEGDKLVDCSPGDMNLFWKKLLDTFNVNHLPVEIPEGALCNWRVRPSDFKEFDYEEIRLFSVYNPTNYKKKMKINIKNGYNLLKIVNEKNCKVKAGAQSMEVELLPNANLSVEFGVFL